MTENRCTPDSNMKCLLDHLTVIISLKSDMVRNDLTNFFYMWFWV